MKNLEKDQPKKDDEAMKAESFRVGRGRWSVVVYRVETATVSGWRFKAGGKVVTRKAKEEARRLAREWVEKAEAGEDFLGNLSGEKREVLARLVRAIEGMDELRELLLLVEERRRGETVATLAADYLTEKVEAKGETSHLRQVRAVLDRLGREFGSQPLVGVTSRELSEWFGGLVEGKGASRHNFVRSAVVGLWNWAARRDRITRTQAEVAACLRRRTVESGDIRIASIPETIWLLQNVRKEYRLAVVLGIFAGMRPEQVAPDSRRGKKGLCRSAISLEDGVIYVSREVSKTFAHVIPISDCLASWMDWAGWEPGQVFPIAKRGMAEGRETVRLGKLMDEYFERAEGWPHDWLRHTYGSNRNALVRNLAQVAEEMGTSPKMMHSHYHQPRARKDGEEFFSLRPRDLLGEQVIEFSA